MEDLSVEYRDGVAWIRLDGELVLDTTAGLKARMEEILADPSWQALVFQLTDVGFLDSSGIGLLVALNNQIKQRGKSFFIYKPSQSVTKTLHLVKLTSFLTIVQDEEDLLASLPD
ncbi:MAG: anti-sigma factor antagonist [Deltaproteobacteria bacterium]|nr:anti-sigma factor antagonist [Deltaproteobacteria bacterium]